MSVVIGDCRKYFIRVNMIRRVNFDGRMFVSKCLILIIDQMTEKESFSML